MKKTNVARLLDAAKIPYQLIEYQYDENNLAATHVAEQLGEDISRVFKTIVLRGDKSGLFVCVIPGDLEVDLKKAAKVSGNKSCSPLSVKELLPNTGYIRGGCSPIGMKKPLPTFYHNTAVDRDFIYVSAGTRGMQVRLKPQELITYTHGTIADLVV
ncbi:MAG TPA: Cys-tRNA(Pro) deacylase [Bacteroidales bacterium]|nr:Cys-tRNA(Pro) deacylase [Bacteroidales bacterium]